MTAAAWGDGRIYRRGSRYWIAYYAPKGRRSVQVRESAGTSESAAQRLLARRLREVEAHREGVRPFLGPAAARATVADLVEEFIADGELRRIASIRPTTSHARALLGLLGDHRATSLSGADVRRYVEVRRKDGRADATIDRELEILRAAYRLAQRDGRIAWAPPVPRLSVGDSNARKGFIDPADFYRLLAVLAEESADFADFVEWFWVTAMRPGEIASLKWSSVHGEQIQLEAADAKIGRARVLPLVGRLAELIEARRKRMVVGLDLVFHLDGERATRCAGGFSKAVYGLWGRSLVRAGLAPSTLIYDLRRSAIRNLRLAGFSDRTIMEISGHKTRSTFDRYAIVTQDEVAEAIRTVTKRHTRGQNEHRRGTK